MEDKPHVRETLCNFSNVVACGARSRRTGLPCRQPAMVNGRCRFHGGKSTGPKTSEGLQAISKSKYTHGLYSRETQELLADSMTNIESVKTFISEALE